MRNSFKLRSLSIAALVGLASMSATNSAEANETPITPTLGENSAYTLDTNIHTPDNFALYKYDNTGITEDIYYYINLKSVTYGEGDASVTTNFTVLNQEVPYTYKFDNLYGDIENGNTSVDTSVTVLGQPVTFTYKHKYNSILTSDSRIENKTDISSTILEGDFKHTLVESGDGDVYGLGGAIYNSGAIGGITGAFNGSSVLATGNDVKAYGGAIYNTGAMGDITGAFNGNYVSATSDNGVKVYGGAIFNSTSGEIGNITGNFIGNYLKAHSDNYTYEPYAYGGAIHNGGSISNIVGDFIGNYVEVPGWSSSQYIKAYGGAISNTGADAKIESITGNFIGNYIKSNYDAKLYGGAIYNSGTIGDLKGDFIGNYLESVEESARGGAIYNSGTIGDITGDFIGNFVKSTDKVAGSAVIFNSGSIGNIVGDIIGNYTVTENSPYIAEGGIIENNGTIASITGDFVGNYSTGNYNVDGGIIFNNKTIGDITGDFIGNYSDAETSLEGGVIYNYGNGTSIGNITGNFVGNHSESGKLPPDYGSGYIYGGVIYNSSYSSIGDIIGDFIGNYAVSGHAAYGGAIYNSGTIGDLKGDYIGNYIQSTSTDKSAYGGAIYNSGTIGDLTGNFIQNYTASTGNDTYGGAIYNGGTIGDLKGDFIGNYAYSDKKYYAPYGGAIYNKKNGSITSITGNFIGNYLSSPVYTTRSYGGAVYNGGTIGDIKGNFIKNYAEAGSYSSGGAIYNSGTIRNITSDFIQNYSEGSGGALSNSGTIDLITGNFIGNYATGSGGAISNSNSGTIKNITADFIQNYSQQGLGGAMSVNGTIENLTANFIQNYAEDSGGAISISGDYATSIKNINGTFNGNYVQSEESVRGGAVHLSSPYYQSEYTVIENISGSFISNYAKGSSAYGGAVYVINNNAVYPSTIENITAEFVNNYVQAESLAYGGAIYVEGTLGTSGGSSVIPADTVQYAKLEILNSDGSIYKQFFMVQDSEGNVLTEDQLKTFIADGTVTNIEYLASESQSISKSEFDTELEGMGMTEDQYFTLLEDYLGVIYTDPSELFANNQQPVDPNTPLPPEPQLAVDDVRANKAVITLKNANILNNFAESSSGGAKGGAVYVKDATIKVNADNGETTLISGNYTKNGEEIDDNAIYMNGGKLIFDVTNSSTIQLDDNINGENNYETYIIGDSASKFILNNKIKNSTTHLIDTNLYLLNDSNLDGNNLKLHSGMLSMINNQAGVSALNSLTVTGDTNVLVDVDLANKSMDRFTASEYGSHGGNLNVTGMNLLSDAVGPTTEILFAEQGLKDNVTNGLAEVGNGVNNTHQTVAYTPIYKYNVSYDNRDDAGYFIFARPSAGGSTGSETPTPTPSNPSIDFNPAVLGGSTSATVGAIGTVNQTFNHAFGNADTFMNIPYLERISMKNRNKYALSITGDATDMGRFSPLYQPSQEEASVWVKPYATFETVGLKNGPKVHNNTYGTLVGFDTEMQSLRRGWDRVITGYIGYNGASQRYSGVDSTQNGGLIGGTVTMYKGNFFNATTVSVGANVAQNQTMYGKDDFAMLLSGIGNKTGYNFEFKEGKLILQPSMLMSYTFVNTFDYTNAAGVRIDNKPLHALQLAPGVKVIGNLKNGWQPYASVQMVWNLMGESDATANGVKLPEMSIKPYVQYGVGVQKRIKDHFTAYGQAMIQNGGRNGISLTGGFRWALGHDKCKYEEQKVERVNDKSKTLSLGEGANSSKKIIKQMTPEQRMALGGGKYMNTSRTAKSGSLRQY